jgi:WD40 repeat protein
MRKFTNMRGRIIRLAFSPEGTTLAAAVRGGDEFGLWEWPGGKFRSHNPYIDGPVSTLAYSPCGKWFVVGGDVGLALPYIRAKDNYDSEMHGGRPVDGVAFSSRVVKRHTVVAIGSDRVRLYDLDAPYDDKKALWDEELQSVEGWYRSVAFHPLKDVLVACETERKALHVWNPRTRERLRLPVVRKSGPTVVAFSATGERLMVGYGGHAQLIDSETWGTVAVCKHSRGRVADLAASPDGKWFATAGTDHTVRLWHATTGEPGRVFDWEQGAMSAVAFSPDGLTCAAGGYRGQVVVWDVDE